MCMCVCLCECGIVVNVCLCVSSSTVMQRNFFFEAMHLFAEVCSLCVVCDTRVIR